MIIDSTAQLVGVHAVCAVTNAPDLQQIRGCKSEVAATTMAEFWALSARTTIYARPQCRLFDLVLDRGLQHFWQHPLLPAPHAPQGKQLLERLHWNLHVRQQTTSSELWLRELTTGMNRLRLACSVG